jgi:type IV secretory pathway VirB10-like protein
VADTDARSVARAVSRSLILPIIGLAGIILYGTTQAALPTADEVSQAQASARPAPPPPRAQAEAPPPPPPAPRLRSVVEAEEAARARTDSTRLSPADTASGQRTEYAPLDEESEL